MKFQFFTCLFFISLSFSYNLLEDQCFASNDKSPSGLEGYIVGCDLWNFGIPDPKPLNQYNTSLHLNIHLVPHTHDDIGWLKTVDQYYYGAWSNVTYAGVQYVLDSVLGALALDTDKRFIYVEMGFFERWWNEQKPSTQQAVKNLVANGQLEFINGGWCMNDEATVYYEDSVDQMTLGHQFLLNTFGVIPKVSWHIDPFGHAAAQAALFAQMGFKAFFFSRLDYQEKPFRLNNSAMEMIWQPNTSQGMENAIFTHITYYHYSDPRGFCFDIRCTDDPIMDDPDLEMYNVDQKGDDFVAWFRQMAYSYRTPELFHTMGTDFAYQSAAINFKNMDRLINYVNANSKRYNVSVSYSTPSNYLNAINKLNKTYPNMADDFFPYADEDNAYWTGYFTSRTAMKGLTRKVGRFAQAIKKWATQLLWANSSSYVYSNFSTVNSSLYNMEVALATAQHHDGVTGTEQQHVVVDYIAYLDTALDIVKQGFVYPYLKEKVHNDLGLNNLQYSTCDLNISSVFCNATYQNLPKGQSVLLSIFNPAQTRNSTMRIKVANGNVQTFDSHGNAIATDVICANYTDTTDCDLFFTSTFNGNALSYFYLKPTTTSNEVKAENIDHSKEYQINSNQYIKSGSLQAFTLRVNQNGKDSTFDFNLKHNYYLSYDLIDPCGAVSGAYLFRPGYNTNNGSIQYAQPQDGSVYRGKNLLQFRIESNKTYVHIRIYGDISSGIEISTFLQPLGNPELSGNEVVIVVETNIKNNGIFYTDSMGMEMQKRVRNYRPTWPLKVLQQVAGNYYPIQSAIYIQDTTSGMRVGLVPDRAQGGGSIKDGEIELMLHRRISRDDSRGVGEPLNELDWDGKGLRQWVTHKLFLNNFAGINTDHRMIQYNDDQPNQVFLAPTSTTPFNEDSDDYIFENVGDTDWNYIKTWSRAYNLTTILYRFQNLDELTNRTVPTSFFQTSAFGKATVIEMTLSFNQAKADMIKNKMNWNGKVYNNPNFINTDYLTQDHFTLRPLEIRTFKVVLSAPHSEMEISL